MALSTTTLPLGNTSRDELSATSLGSLCHALRALSGKKFLPITTTLVVLLSSLILLKVINALYCFPLIY